MTKPLRTGITTGACAAAAAKAAAALYFSGRILKEVTVYNLQGQPILVPISEVRAVPGGAMAVVIKDGGDDPDVTSGLPVVAEVRPGGEGIKLCGGPGVGRVTKPGLAVPVGQPAINPVPREMILAAVREFLPPGQGAEITISVPGGEKVAGRTLNPRLGIVGGISILGTTGIVRPMSEEAYRDSLVPFLDVARSAGFNHVVLTPGRTGARAAVERYGFPADAVVEMGNFVGFMLERCAERGFEGVLLWGHHGKMVKIAGGIFHTHNRVADARREILASHAALMGADREVIARIMAANTLESVVELLAGCNLLSVYDRLACRASQRAMELVHRRLKVGTALLDLKGQILGLDRQAVEIGRKLGCRALK